MKKHKYDLDTIQELVSMEDLASVLGIETRLVGGKLSILCPFHSDEHFGSAFVWENGIYCFAEEKFYSLFDVYMQVTGSSFSDAVEDIVRIFALPEAVQIDNKKEDKILPFTRAELKAIGLIQAERRSERYIMGCSDENQRPEQGYCVKKTAADEYIIYKKGSSQYIHLMELMQAEPDTFWRLVANKCLEQYEMLAESVNFLRAMTVVLQEQGVTHKLTEKLLETTEEQLCLVKNVHKKVRKKG